MPTIKDRVNITIDKDRSRLLKTLAKRDKVSVSAKILELVDDALELEEDLIWAKIADKRRKEKNVKYIPHEILWRSLK